MSATNACETALLQLLFNATTYDTIAENDSTSPATSFYVSLHTADPGEAGSQTTNEATYTGYARVAVARTSGGFTISGGNCSNTAAVTFAQCTAGSNTITYFGVGTGSTGTGALLFSGALSSSLAVSSGITPEFAIGELDVNLD